MRNTIYRTLVVAFALSMTACNSIDVKTDHDATADFSRFKSFAFVGLAKADRGGVYDNSLTRQRIESAISRELTRKGLHPSDTA
jgi:hypothetical protein